MKQGDDEKELKKQLSLVFETVHNPSKVFVYNIQDDADQDVDAEILKAVFQGSEVTLENKLHQGIYTQLVLFPCFKALNFDRVSIASQALQDSRKEEVCLQSAYPL